MMGGKGPHRGIVNENNKDTDSSASQSRLLDSIDRRTLLKSSLTAAVIGASFPAVSRAQQTEDHKLLAEDGTGNDQFGSERDGVALSFDGTTAFIGARHNNNENGRSAGAAYVFERGTNGWRQVDKLTAEDGTPDAGFGSSISTSRDGTVALIGAVNDDNENGEDAGAAYIFELGNDGWRQADKLVAEDGREDYGFGASVDINSTGTTALIGSGLPDSAHVFESVDDGWTQADNGKLTAGDPFQNDDFGSSVSIDANGTTALVGASQEDLDASSGEIEAAGAAHIFEDTSEGWTQVGPKLTAEDAKIGAEFGFSVSLTADGTAALIGAELDKEQGLAAGAAYIFKASEEGWTQIDKLLADDGTSGDQFGSSVSISADGTRGIIGSPFATTEIEEGVGKAYVFDVSDSGWAQVEDGKLIASDGESDDWFGKAVSNNSDGTVKLVGAPRNDNENGADAGAAYVFGEPAADKPSLVLDNVRLVQTVENTKLQGDAQSSDIPEQIPLVEDRSTFVLFDVTGETGQPTEPVQVRIVSDDGSIDEEFGMDNAVLDRMFDGETLLDVISSEGTENTFDADNDGNFNEYGPPLFDLGDDVNEITLEIITDSGVVADTTAQVDRPIQSMPTIDIGVIALQPADRYNDAAINADLLPEEDYITAYETNTRWLAKRMQRMFPTPQVNVYRYDIDEETDLINSLQHEDPSEDQQTARTELERQLPISGTSDKQHTFAVKDGSKDGDVEFMINEEDGFDVTLCLTPVGYFVYYGNHGKDWDRLTSGSHISGWDSTQLPNVDDPLRQPAASALVRIDSPDSGAHEAGHHFLGQPYDDELAQITPEGNTDDAHASEDLRSDTFAVEGQSSVFYRKIEKSNSSFMTQGNRGWMDMFSFDLFTNDEFTPTPPEGTRTEGQSLALVGSVVETGIDILSFSTGIGYNTDVEIGDLSAILSDSNGNTIAEFEYPTGIIEVSQNGFTTVEEDLVFLELSYPEETYEVHLEVDDTTTTVNPVSQLLSTAISRIPTNGFVRRPDERRIALNNKLDEIEEKMDAKEFHEAKQKLENDFRRMIKRWLEDEYEAAANEFTKQELLDLVDDMIARLESLAQSTRNRIE